VTIETVRERAVGNPIISMVVPVRNRHGPMIKNCLRSVELQTLEPLELIIVDYGSTWENHEKLLRVLPDCTVYYYDTDEPWSLATARNIGLRRAHADHSCVLDADLIMEPSVLKWTLKIHMDFPTCYVTTKVILLDPSAINPYTLELPRDFTLLQSAGASRRAEGWGGFISAPTAWWHECRGFDERMKWWGWEDVDMWKRAARAGLGRNHLCFMEEPDIEIYHQYHTNIQIAAIRQQNAEIYDAIKQNEYFAKRSSGILRNDENWGLWSEG
jgi:GT2 family glycosyltransferase